MRLERTFQDGKRPVPLKHYNHERYKIFFCSVNKQTSPIRLKSVKKPEKAAAETNTGVYIHIGIFEPFKNSFQMQPN